MRAERPEHLAGLVDRMTGNRDAADNDDAAALLDLVEDAGERGVERRVAAMLRQDVAERPALPDKPAEQLFERGGLPRGQVEGDAVLAADVAAAPGHRMIDKRGKSLGHGATLDSVTAALRSLAQVDLPRKRRQH